MIDVIFVGRGPLSADVIAERAGVSVASLFRYFENLDDLRAESIGHYFNRFADLFEVPDIGVGDLTTRVTTLVDARLRQHETTAPMARLVRARSFDLDDLGAQLGRLRATNSDQIRLHFDPELAMMSRAVRDDTVATIALLTSFESWDQFTRDHDRSKAQIKRAWRRALTELLG